MPKLNVQQTQQFAAQAGFTGTGLQTITAIAICESGLDTASVNTTTSGLGIDRGLVKLNSFFHPEVSDQCAYDALCAMQQAYRISKHGTDFSEWVTFTNGCASRNMSQAGIGLSGSFAATPLWLAPFMAKTVSWWEQNGHHYTSGSGPGEGGVDWNPEPLDAPITAILSGRLLSGAYFGSSSWCLPQDTSNGHGVVTILSNNPRPDLVPGSQIAVYYQHIIIDPSLNLGCAPLSNAPFIQAGQVIGRGNGSYNVEVGVNIGIDWGRNWGGTQGGPPNTGPHVDPIPWLYAVVQAGGGGGAVSGGGVAKPFLTAARFLKNNINLKADANIISLLAAMDASLVIYNPLELSDSQRSQVEHDVGVPGLGTFSFNDPVQYVEYAAQNFAQIFVAAFIRSAIDLTGIYICWKMINSLLNVSDVFNKVAQGVTTGAKVAALLA